MDKEYLIHNIDYKDNPEDQHQTLDITLSNLELAGQNITADVGIDTFVNGMPTSSNKYEDVSLTGAGGGGGDTATITVNYFLEGDPLPNITAAGINWAYYGQDTADHSGSVIIQVHETPYTFTIPIIPGSTLVSPYCMQTNDNYYIPIDNISITGDAVWDAEEHRYIISGDATINCDMDLD